MANEKFGLVVKSGNREEIYDLAQIPKTKSFLVQEQRELILQKLDLQSVLTNIDNAAGLLYVAYNALAGTMVQSKLSGLQKELLDLCNRSILSVTKFKLESDEICNIVIKSYGYLRKFEEPVATNLLGRCSQRAKRMQDECDLLAKGFERIATKTEIALEQSQDCQAVEFSKAKKLQEEILQLKADQEQCSVKSKMLEEEILETDAMYNEAKMQEKTAAAKEERMEIINLVVSVFSSAVQAVSGSDTEDKAMQEASVQKEEQKALKKDTEEKQAEVKTQIEALQKEITETQEKKKTITAELEDKGESVEGNEELKSLDKEIENKKASLKKLETKNTDYSQQLSAVGKVLDGITAKLGKMAEKNANARASAAAERKELLKKKQEQQKENRDLLSSMAKFAQLIEANISGKEHSETAVRTLQVAIMCLKQIVTSLTKASFFWRSVEQYCDRLSNATFLEEIKLLAETDKAFREEEYGSYDFMYGLISFAANWVALSSVCEEYLTASQETQFKIDENMKKGYLPEESWAVAEEEARNLLGSIDEQLKICDKNTQLLEQQKAAI